jgi:hypothetical protein
MSEFLIIEHFDNALRLNCNFIAITVAWRKALPFADDQEIVRAQQLIVSRHRERVRRAGFQRPIILSVFERSAKLGTHGHILLQVPGQHERWLRAIERQLIRMFGTLPPNFLWFDGRHGGKIQTCAAAIGAMRYRLKSIATGEGPVRRGVGLKPLPFRSVRVSRGRA